MGIDVGAVHQRRITEKEPGLFFVFWQFGHFPAISCTSHAFQKRGQIRPFLGRPIFFRPIMHAGGGVHAQKKRGSTPKEKRDSTQKNRSFKKKHRRRHRTLLSVRVATTQFTLGTEEVHTHIHTPQTQASTQPQGRRAQRELAGYRAISSGNFLLLVYWYT